MDGEGYREESPGRREFRSRKSIVKKRGAESSPGASSGYGDQRTGHRAEPVDRPFDGSREPRTLGASYGLEALQVGAEWRQMKQPTDATVNDSSSSPASSPLERELFGEKLRFVVDTGALFLPATTPTRQVLEEMRKHGKASVLLTGSSGEKALAGIFTERDYLDKLAGQPELESEPIERFMTASPKTLSGEGTVGDAIRWMTEGGYRHIPILSEDGACKGTVSVRNIVEFISEHFPEEVYNLPPNLKQQISTQEGG